MLHKFHEDYMKIYNCAVVDCMQIPFYLWDQSNANTVFATAQSFILRPNLALGYAM